MPESVAPDRRPVDHGCALKLEVSPSPAMAALVEAQTQMLKGLRETLSQWLAMDSGALTTASWCRELAWIAGTFRYCGAHSIATLCTLMNDVAVKLVDVSPAAIQALDSACSALTAALPSLQQGDAVPAGYLLPAWRELAAQLSGSSHSGSASASAMIVIPIAAPCESVRAAEEFLLSYRSSLCSSHGPSTSMSMITVSMVDKILLDLLRADTGSEALRDSLNEVAVIISLLKHQVSNRLHRLYWGVMLVYCELLLTDAPIDIAQAKKNIAVAIRVIRLAAQHASFSTPALPDKLVREVLFQIGLFAPVTTLSQRVRDIAALDWQLSPYDDQQDGAQGQTQHQKDQWLARFDELERGWSDSEPCERRQQIEAMASGLQILPSPAVAAMAPALLALQVDGQCNDLGMAAGLLLTRTAVESLAAAEGGHLHRMARQALNTLATHAGRSRAEEKAWWHLLTGLAPGLYRPKAKSALRSATLLVLRDTEQKLDLLFESGDVAAAHREMIAALSRVGSALTVAGAIPAAHMADVLRRELQEVATAEVPADAVSVPDALQRMALNWVRLCDWIDAWPAVAEDQQSVCGDLAESMSDMPEEASTHEASTHEASTHADIHQAGQSFSYQLRSHQTAPPERTVESLPDQITPGDQLEQIFIQEATQRLSRLTQSLSVWMDKAASDLPALPETIAYEAHGLAGSSATAGHKRLHLGALALEQAVDCLVRLPASIQQAHASDLIQGVQALEQALHLVQTDAGAKAPKSLKVPKAPKAPKVADAVPGDDLTRVDGPDDARNDPLDLLLQLPGRLVEHYAEHEREPLLAEEAQGAYSDIPVITAIPAIPSIPSDAAVSTVALKPACDTVATHPDIAPDALFADAELLAVFSEEAAELLPLLVQKMSGWLASPQDDSLRSGVLRLLHTLKGSARMAGQTMLGERLHELEHEVSQMVRTEDPMALRLNALRHQMAQVLDEAGMTSGTDPDTAPFASARSTVSTTSSTSALLTIPAASTVSAVSAASAASATSAVSSPELSAPERWSQDVTSATPKLRSDLLERASGSAAELLVGAARAAEESQRQRQTVSDLSDNLLRLRTQLRELELQSESRITAQAQPSASVFDPLEFDRYTRLQELTRMTAESLADLTSLQRTLGRQAESVIAMLSQQTRHARQLQSDLRRAGMQTFASIELRLRHLVKQVASETGREVRFELEGAQIEIDRVQLDRLSGALAHLIRNAIVHGIELPSQRAQASKPRCGVVRLSLCQQGGELRLQISDDGRGLDLARIRARALELGLLDELAEVDEAQLAEMIFHPGLSTAEEVTGLAGRGIGMDAVKEAVLHMGGALKVDSLAGAGTCITLGLPQLLSTQQVLVVSSGKQTMALPASLVQQLMQPNEATLRQSLQEGSIDWQRQTMPVRRLTELQGLSATPGSAALSTQRPSVVILRQLDQWLAVIVDEVLGHREVVVKQVGLQLAGVTGLAGATLQADGSVLLIVNPLQWFDQLASHRRMPQAFASSDPIFDKAPLVMVVDDSLTVRRVSQRLLERRGYRVAVARHGIEALEQLRELTPAALLLDIEMPRMDGFELLSRLRADARLQAVPVAMVTSRAAERHRLHAMQLGANAYFGKPYRDQELFDWLSECAPLPQVLIVSGESDENSVDDGQQAASAAAAA